MINTIYGRASRQVKQFFTGYQDPSFLFFFRASISIIILVQIVLVFPYIPELLGNRGWIQWAIIEEVYMEKLPTIGKIALFASRYGIPSLWTVYFVFSLYAFCIIGLLLGWYTRCMAIGACLLHCLMNNTGDISTYGVDTMVQMSLFYCCLMPVGNIYSLDATKGVASDPLHVALSKRVLQLHVCLIYLSSGIEKISGAQWWNGEAIWRTLMQYQFRVFDFSWLAHYPLLAKMICWSTLLLEAGYALFIWGRRTRLPWLLGIILLHLFICFCMGLFLFGWTMIVLNISAFGTPYIKKVQERCFKAFSKKPFTPGDRPSSGNIATLH